eukprot:NODE_8383_length_1499_cov_6.336006.p2 GENE.NODE_8383_length_1499_cov_6.336006~~NODE_8383_length_1499_cov_6.336006.p2  ORF type:complete len:311 (+),score=18.89 NODE_8383_length_1499_cov_6.336006:245-1177(+)
MMMLTGVQFGRCCTPCCGLRALGVQSLQNARHLRSVSIDGFHRPSRVPSVLVSWAGPALVPFPLSRSAPPAQRSSVRRISSASAHSSSAVRTNGRLPTALGPLPIYGQRSMLGPTVEQVRYAGRLLGFKRKGKGDRTRTIQQTGLGKRMEFVWPRRRHRTRVPLYENSRRHIIWDHRMRVWMVMWYRHGIQVFRTFSARRSYKFEQSRMRAIIFYQQLQNAGKLGRPKPDQNRAGVRGVFFDKDERAWVAKWNDCGLKKYAVYRTEEMGFAEAYRAAVRMRVQTIRRNHQFMMQRTRWRTRRRPLGGLQS